MRYDNYPCSGFYADPHFNHANIISYSNRPFASLTEMNEKLVANYNNIFTTNDFVIWVGDCFFGSVEQAAEILRSMNGRKALVIGGHDGSSAKCLRIGFEFVVQEMSMLIDGRICQVNHFSYAGTEHARIKKDDRFSELRPRKKEGQWLIHGHTHATTKGQGRMIHVGVDAREYKPVTMEEIIYEMRSRFIKKENNQCL